LEVHEIIKDSIKEQQKRTGGGGGGVPSLTTKPLEMKRCMSCDRDISPAKQVITTRENSASSGYVGVAPRNSMVGNMQSDPINIAQVQSQVSQNAASAKILNPSAGLLPAGKNYNKVKTGAPGMQETGPKPPSPMNLASGITPQERSPRAQSK